MHFFKECQTPLFESLHSIVMAKFLRPGKVVVVLNGRFAGKKAVIVKNTYRSHIIIIQLYLPNRGGCVYWLGMDE